MTPAGKRDSRVSIERATATTDSYGEANEAWNEIGTRWTAIYYGKGQERRQAAVEQGQQSATFVMLSDELTRTVTIRDRLSYRGTWDIVGVSPVGRAEIEFTAVRAT